MKKYNHLFKIPNDSEGKAFVSTLKKYMRDSDSIHTLRIKGRNPYVGYVILAPDMQKANTKRLYFLQSLGPEADPEEKELE